MLPSLAQAGNRLAQAIARLRGRKAHRHISPPASLPPPREPEPAGATGRRAAQIRSRRPRGPQVPGPARPAGLGSLPRTAHAITPGPVRAARRACPYVAAELVKLNEGLRSMGHLRRYLVEHPALVWLLGFPLVLDPAMPHGFNVERSLPSRRQLGRVLRELDPAAAQFLLTATVQLIRQALPSDVDFGDVVAGDTKHILAWVKENNPKQYVDDRYDKTKQPTGDPTASSVARNATTRARLTATGRAPPRSRRVRHPHDQSRARQPGHCR